MNSYGKPHLVELFVLLEAYEELMRCRHPLTVNILINVLLLQLLESLYYETEGDEQSSLRFWMNLVSWNMASLKHFRNSGIVGVFQKVLVILFLLMLFRT